MAAFHHLVVFQWDVVLGKNESLSFDFVLHETGKITKGGEDVPYKTIDEIFGAGYRRAGFGTFKKATTHGATKRVIWIDAPGGFVCKTIAQTMTFQPSIFLAKFPATKEKQVMIPNSKLSTTFSFKYDPNTEQVDYRIPQQGGQLQLFGE